MATMRHNQHSKRRSEKWKVGSDSGNNQPLATSTTIQMIYPTISKIVQEWHAAMQQATMLPAVMMLSPVNLNLMTMA